MTRKQKQDIADQITELLSRLIEDRESEPELPQQTSRIEMLTIKEASEMIQGLSEYTIRMMLQQNKLSCVRTGEGTRGKILINKQELLDYFGGKS
jgi:excisionase family DNA binding protein